MTDQVVRVCRIPHLNHFVTDRIHGQYRATFPLMALVTITTFINLGHRHRIRNIPSFGVSTLLTKDFRRVHNRFAGQVLAKAHHHVNRVFGDFFRGDAGIHNLVNKGTVGTVLQQPANQVSQQVFVSTHRRVDPARHTTVLQNLIVQGFPHTMQALELEFIPTQILGQFQHR